MIGKQKFPKDFLWGASTASHQVEGGTNNQWSRWELEHAAELAASAEKRLSWLPNWADIKKRAEDPANYVSGEGIDHLNRYEEDFDLLEKLQFNSFRFGIEWSRIQPEEGVFNADALEHYHDYIDSLNHRGVEPILNLWHWTMPAWFADKGGFEKKENLVYFDTFVRKVAEEYADKVQYIITLNEPNVYATFGYLNGEWPPQQRSFKKMVRVYWNLSRAHNRAYGILKARRATLMVGVAAQLGNVVPKRAHNWFDIFATWWMRYAWNWWFLNRTRRHQDFIGVNYYFTDYYKGVDFSHQPKKSDGQMNAPVVVRRNPLVPLNDLGWYMEPEGLYGLIMRVWAHYKKPIIITETGVADENDEYRTWWIEQTVLAMQRALSEGVDLRGCMHWSLLDNFEWAYGWWPKFGLIAVDRENDMKRTPRPSALQFARILKELRVDAPFKSGASKIATTTTTAQRRTSQLGTVGHQTGGGNKAKPVKRSVHPLMTVSTDGEAIAAQPKKATKLTKDTPIGNRLRLAKHPVQGMRRMRHRIHQKIQ
jgi:beta-glucosidase